MSAIEYSERLRSEIAHGEKIAASAQRVWNWEGAIGRARYERRLQYLSTALKPGLRALELGCGTGLFSTGFSRSGATMVSIDISPDLLRQAQARKLPHVQFLIADACQTGFDAASFDAVVGSSILHHLDIPASLKECYRLLKPGGSLHFTEPNYLNPHVFFERKIPWLKKRLGVSDYESAIVRWPLEKLLKKIGFREIEIQPFDFLYPFLPERCLGGLDRCGRMLEKIPLLREVAGSVQIKAIK